jgi:hypothetical protein
MRKRVASRKARALLSDLRRLADFCVAHFIVWRELRRRRREGTMLPRRADELGNLESLK